MEDCVHYFSKLSQNFVGNFFAIWFFGKNDLKKSINFPFFGHLKPSYISIEIVIDSNAGNYKRKLTRVIAI